MRERVISATIALLITIPLLLLGGIYFKLLIVVLGILSLKEIMNAKNNIHPYMRYITYLLFLLFMVNGFELVDITFSININVILLSIFFLFVPVVIYNDDKKYNMSDALFLFGSLIFLSLTFNIFMLVRDGSLYLFIYLLLVSILTDTFAYFIGIKYGKHKLIPEISPNKSVEGMIGGTLFGVVVSSIYYYFCIGNANAFIIVFVTLILSLTGQIGDLIFSSIKRHYKIKDFSNIMPGHGGILDRLDSIIFIMIVYMLLYVVL